ncbi:MAG TPA: phosphate ABC transporter substrate-binding protein PstS [Segeticoccus sp.]|uniref:phosphate ABC transporter substrate-binding protein PstS n=1 Tax=Segeticoccus sp. TaxID=2706531 RepID=UPI002D7F4A86|nr:phosphate ABC transporter substrate-binding protein PstS [Segeticoccus sp.]HET8600129.1 phosphate ABC transporter substrate-binding protein PstS [Segeticoccus sp.]
MERSILRRRLCVSVAAAAATVLLGGCGAVNERAAGATAGSETTGVSGSSLSGTINGAGSSAQAAAVAAWKAAFEESHPNVTVNYDPVGSGGGREQFISGGVDFGGSDAYLASDELAQAKKRCSGGQLIEVPVYLSPIAVVYHLQGVKDLRLSPDTLAKIFARKITTWDDPAIKRDNPGTTLPNTPITAVNRSDDSGTTENFTDYLAKAAPTVWTYQVSGMWPLHGGEAAKGTTGVVQAVTSGTGTIGYADDSQIGDLPSARITVGNHDVSLTSTAAARVVDVSTQVPGRGTYDDALNLQRTPKDSNTYPIVLASYQLFCTTYSDPNKAALAKAWLSYIGSKEGQHVAARAAGSAPLSGHGRSLVTRAAKAIQTP